MHRWAKEMLRNVRMSCCVAGNCHLQASEEDVKETLELLAARLQLPPGPTYSLVKAFRAWQQFCSMWHATSPLCQGPQWA